jgi:hypothetical protein
MRSIPLLLLTLVLYLAVVGATAWGLFAARRAAIKSFDNPAEQARWEDFRATMDERHSEREALREEIARESGQPIAPALPKSRSPRPPALELLANHFAACLTVSLLAASGLFAVLWGLFVGAVLRPGRKFGEVEVDESPAGVRPSQARQLR